MEVQVKLNDIIEGLEFLTDEGSSYLNTTTGEVVYITTEELRAAEEEQPLEDFPEWQHDAIRIAGEIIETDHYLPLPDRFEINEYPAVPGEPLSDVISICYILGFRKDNTKFFNKLSLNRRHF